MGPLTTRTDEPRLDPGAAYAECCFRAMNTDVMVRALDPAAGPALAAVEQLFASMERRFSRFLADSELSRLNASLAGAVEVSPAMFALLRLAQRLHRDTGGIFNPAVLPQLERAGYDRSFERVDDGDGITDEPREIAPFSALRLDHRSRTVLRPAGMRLDLGGIGKGWSVDRAARQLAPLRDFHVSAGGDMAACGDCGDGDGWPASVIHPQTGDQICVLRLHNEALATSSTAVRAWRRGSARMHHLIDPRTGRPAATDVVSASVVAPTAAIADVYAKTVLMLGRRKGFQFLDGHGCAGLFVTGDGHVATTARWQ